MRKWLEMLWFSYFFLESAMVLTLEKLSGTLGLLNDVDNESVACRINFRTNSTMRSASELSLSGA